MRRFNYDLIEITDLIGFENGMIIRWASPEIGWGEYTLHINTERDEFGFIVADPQIEGDSEYMDSNENKSFLKALLNKLIEKTNIIS